MSTLRTRIVLSMTAFLNKTIGTQAPAYLGQTVSRMLDPVVYDWPDGSGAAQASEARAFETTLTVGTPETINIKSYLDAHGDSTSLAHVKGFMLHVVSGTALVDVSDTFNPLSTSSSASFVGLAAGSTVAVVRPEGIAIGSGNNLMTLTPTGTGTVLVRVIIVGD